MSMLSWLIGRRTINLDDDRLFAVWDATAALSVNQHAFWRTLIDGDPSLTIAALILKQALTDGANALHVFVDWPGYCARILEFIRVPDGYVELPWRTVDDRDWDSEVAPFSINRGVYYPVEQCPTTAGSTWGWVQMKPLGLILGISVPMKIRELAGIRSHGQKGVIRLRSGSRPVNAAVEAPELFDLRVFFDRARPTVRPPPQ